MDKDIFRFYVVILGLAFVAGVIFALACGSSDKDSDSNSKMELVWNYIDKYYLEPVNPDTLVEGAIKGMISTLDPHSTYESAADNQRFMEEMNGSFEGVGIQFNIMNDTVMVVATVNRGPSEQAGIRAGDRMVSVNDTNIAGVGITSERIYKMLRGKKGTTVNIGIMRPSFDEIYHYEVTRNVIPTYTIDVAYMIDKQTGYIKINQFASNTYNDFKEAMTRLCQQGMKALVLDLRGNPGGYLQTAINICDDFLPTQDMIVYTEGAYAVREESYATSFGCFETGGLAVLIDDYSASASEVVAGAIQDNDRGIVVGRRSFGKGLVQRQFTFDDQSSLRLTVARYHTPSGRCIQRSYDEGIEKYYTELIRRYDAGELVCADSIKFDESLQYRTKKGRVVYGGGGIMPDIFVPMKNSDDQKDLNRVLNTGLHIEFAFDYANKEKAQLMAKYPTAQEFVAKMQDTHTLLQKFITFYTAKTQQSCSLSEAEQQEMRIYLKALVGRNLYQEEGFYPILNSIDETVLKAVEAISPSTK